jgi:hypothetical protein
MFAGRGNRRRADWGKSADRMSRGELRSHCCQPAGQALELTDGRSFEPRTTRELRNHSNKTAGRHDCSVVSECASGSTGILLQVPGRDDDRDAVHSICAVRFAQASE